MNRSSEKRLAANEVICRKANEKVNRQVLSDEDLAAHDGLKLHFFCECSRLDCRARIAMTASQYAAAHADNNRRFIALRGHDIPEIERVVQHEDGYDIIEKYTDPEALLSGNQK